MGRAPASPSGAVFLLAALLLASGPGAGTLSQWGVDAARTGAIAEAGPATDDVLWRTPLQGTTGLFNNILLVGGHAYVSTFDDGGGMPYDVTGLWRVDLATGEAALMPDMPRPFSSWRWYNMRALASDGERLFSTFKAGVAAHRLDGTFLWDFQPARHLPALVEGASDALCLQPALRDGFLYTACIAANRFDDTAQDATGTAPEPEGWAHPVATVVAKLDLAACEASAPVCDPTLGDGWLWVKGLTDDARDATGASVAVQDVDHAAPSQVDAVPTAISVVGDHVVVMMLELEIAFQAVQNEAASVDPALQTASVHAGRSGAWTLGDEDGQVRWSQWVEGGHYAYYRTGLDGRDYRKAPVVDTMPIPYMNVPTGSAAGNRVYLTLGPRGDQLEAVNLAQGYAVEPYWRFQLHQEERAVKAPAYTTQALVGDDLYTATQRFLYRIDVRGGPGVVGPAAAFVLPPGDEGRAWMPASQVTRAGGMVYALSHAGAPADTLLFDARGNAATLHALDAVTLEEAWNATFADPDPEAKTVAASFTVGPGIVLVQTRAGELVAFGSGPTGLQVAADASEVFPAPGAEVAVDLSNTAPGVHGPATAYRADWGDGAVTEWQAGPVLRHAYAAPGPHTARVQARNDAGQTASAFVAFDVGGEPSREPSFLETAFASEHQDTTWGLIGLLAVVVGGAFTAGRLRRRHGRLRREVEALERAYAATRRDRAACDAMLTDRRMRVRGLLLDRRIDEGQFTVLDRRIDELLQSLRLGALEEGFDFLPLGLARALEGMLADGRVSLRERDRFLAALDATPGLEEAQRVQVRDLVDGWLSRDDAAPRPAG